MGNTEEPYYKGTAASMVFLDLPMMDVKFDHIKIFDNELALMICHDFERYFSVLFLLLFQGCFCLLNWFVHFVAEVG